MAKKITIETSVDELRTMQHFEQKFYGTPDAYAPYVAARPSWREDVVLATPQDVIEAEGWDSIEESCEDCLRGEKTCVECAQVIRYTVTV